MRTGRLRWICFPERTLGMSIYFISSCHVETVVLLGREKVDGYIAIDLDIEKLEGKSGIATCCIFRY